VRAAGLLRPSGCARVSRLADQLDAQQAGRRGRSVPSLAASALAVWCWLTDRVNPRPIALWLWSVAAPSRTLLAGQGWRSVRAVASTAGSTWTPPRRPCAAPASTFHP